MIVPGKLLKLLKRAFKSRKYLVMVYWVDKQNKLGAGFKATNFPLAVVDKAFEQGKALFWEKNKKEISKVPHPVSVDGRVPLDQTARREVTKSE
jgi:hypothetical protein